MITEPEHEYLDSFAAAAAAEDRRRTERPEQLEALKRLYAIAQRDSGQCRHVARFLLGLYNGHRFPFDLTDFRCLDRAIFEDCLLVLRLDFTIVKEVHVWLDADFEALAKLWGLAE